LEKNNYHIPRSLFPLDIDPQINNPIQTTCVPNTNEYIETEKNPLTAFVGVDEHHDARHEMIG
jgi:hypothetical protein